MDNELTFRKISQLYKTGRAQQERKNLYTVDRVIEEDHYKGSYLSDLPKFEGKDVLDILDECVQDSTSRVLDVGCGMGNFLLSLSKKYKKKLKCDGLSTHPYHDQQEVDAAGVNIEIGDIQVMYRRNTYDLIVAMHSLEYSQNPLIALKRIYDALKPGGIALLYPLTLHFSSPDDEKKFIDYMSEAYGFAFEKGEEDWQQGWRVSFKKTNKRLSLPVRISKIIDVGNEYIELEQMEYSFVG